jgi:predicted RNA binding protein YcfA (HicA-like mRNA interferase family)
LNAPETLVLSKIENFLASEWFEIKEWRGSHRKIIHREKNITYIYPVHGNDTKGVYKKVLSKMYVSLFTL